MSGLQFYSVCRICDALDNFTASRMAFQLVSLPLSLTLDLNYFDRKMKYLIIAT